MKKVIIIIVVIVVIIVIAYFVLGNSNKNIPVNNPVGSVSKNATWLYGEVQKAIAKQPHDKWADWYFVYSYANTTPDPQQWANEQFTHTGTGAWKGYNDSNWYNKWAGATGGAAARGGNT